MGRHYHHYSQFQPAQLNFTLGMSRDGKTTVNVTYGQAASEVAIVSAAAITMWPRCTGDGNFGTMWGPTDPAKAKYTLDLTDAPVVGDKTNEDYVKFAAVMGEIDDLLLDFVTANQLKVLGRKNLSRDEVKMLQIRTVRPKYDKISGALTGHNVNLSTAKMAYDGMGGKYARQITVCDKKGATVPHGVVAPGDVVAATMYANQIYTGVGGDKFGIHWGFEDVSVICQRSAREVKPEVTAFAQLDYTFGRDYVVSEDTFDAGRQFDTVAVA